MAKIKTTSKYIIRNGRPVSFRVFQEPQADLYQVHISSLGMGLFTKKEIDIALARGEKLRRKYGLESETRHGI